MKTKSNNFRAIYYFKTRAILSVILIFSLCISTAAPLPKIINGEKVGTLTYSGHVKISWCVNSNTLVIAHKTGVDTYQPETLSFTTLALTEVIAEGGIQCKTDPLKVFSHNAGPSSILMQSIDNYYSVAFAQLIGDGSPNIGNILRQTGDDIPKELYKKISTDTGSFDNFKKCLLESKKITKFDFLAVSPKNPFIFLASGSRIYVFDKDDSNCKTYSEFRVPASEANTKQISELNSNFSICYDDPTIEDSWSQKISIFGKSGKLLKTINGVGECEQSPISSKSVSYQIHHERPGPRYHFNGRIYKNSSDRVDILTVNDKLQTKTIAKFNEISTGMVSSITSREGRWLAIKVSASEEDIANSENHTMIHIIKIHN
ncbi:hypothetical protein [Roseateles oligotrophus]|uniref:Uncharacterized protein n=1 Tax=Roseateles oligotrophus TaxID=1769250 RepID=A0ABT2YGC9_9BURK|nr:hypothetical protein [Roseateles oligotrophus]MCV2369116.1 hypothetical protein [Roseateles oligotrophus]